MEKDHIFTLKEIGLLQVLYYNDRTSKMRTMKVPDFFKKLSDSKEGKQSEATVRRGVKKMIKCGFISEGMKNGRQQTFYLTKLGEEFVDNLIIEAEKGIDINE